MRSERGTDQSHENDAHCTAIPSPTIHLTTGKSYSTMASVILVGLPFLVGQSVGSCVDVFLVRTERSIWPFHAVCLGLGLAVGFGWRTSHDGAPTTADYNKLMIVALLVSLSASFLSYGCGRLLWDGAHSLWERASHLVAASSEHAELLVR